MIIINRCMDDVLFLIHMMDIRWPHQWPCLSDHNNPIDEICDAIAMIKITYPTCYCYCNQRLLVGMDMGWLWLPTALQICQGWVQPNDQKLPKHLQVATWQHGSKGGGRLLRGRSKKGQWWYGFIMFYFISYFIIFLIDGVSVNLLQPQWSLYIIKHYK